MMIKKIYLAILPISLLAANMPPMPPMIPNIDMKPTPTASVKNATPQSCELLPPMVVFIPPPMEKMLNDCKNQLHLPKNEQVEKNILQGEYKKLKIKSISITEDFAQLYKIVITNDKKEIELFCNSNLSKCIKGEINNYGK
jgi:hypothetical protein